MDVPYQWYSNSGQQIPAYYPSPSPSSDPSPTPRPHQPLHDQPYLPHSFDQIQSNVGPERALRFTRKTRPLSEHADRFSEPVFLQVTTPYRPGSPSSMASPYSPYDYSQRPRSRSIDSPEVNDILRIPSPAPSIASAGSSLGSTGSTSHHRAEAPPRPILKPKHTKNRLRDVDRKKICLFHLNHKNARQEDIGAHFGVERSTISKVLKEKDKWLKITPEAEANNQTTKHRPSKFPEIEEVLLESLQHWSDRKINITDHLIRQKGLEIARSYHITTDRFKGSSGWVENFKHRHDIKRGEWLQARRIPEPTIPMKQLQPRVIPDTPVIKPYDRVVKPSDYPPEVPFDPAMMATIIRGTKTTPASWGPAPTPVTPQTPQSAPAQEEPHRTQQQQQPALVLDPALQDVPAVTAPLETSHAQHSPHHGAYENGMGIMYTSGANNNVNGNHNTSASTTGNPASSNPTYQEAENALKIVISFLQSDGRDIVKDSDRDILNHIRGAMNQWSNRMYATA